MDNRILRRRVSHKRKAEALIREFGIVIAYLGLLNGARMDTYVMKARGGELLGAAARDTRLCFSISLHVSESLKSSDLVFRNALQNRLHWLREISTEWRLLLHQVSNGVMVVCSKALA